MLDPREGIAPDGTIVTGAARSRVPGVFEPLIAAAVEELSARSQVSVYLYGSVATGQAQPGRSDVDLLTAGLDRDDARAVATSLSEGFPGLCRGVGIAVADAEDLVGESDEAYGFRVFLRHYCVHLYGPDLGNHLPAFRADAHAARGFNGAAMTVRGGGAVGVLSRGRMRLGLPRPARLPGRPGGSRPGARAR